jgi:hypothetical protein
MATRKDWLAESYQGIYDQANMTFDYLDPVKCAEFGIAGEALAWVNNVLKPKQLVYNAAFEDWKNPDERSRAKSKILQDAKKDFVPSYRQLYNSFIRMNPLIANHDLAAMGFPDRPSGGRTPSKPPTEYVELIITAAGPATLTIAYRVRGAAGWAKPDDAHGMEMCWGIFETPPTEWTQLNHSVFSTHTPATITFQGDQRALTVFIAGRWENSVGQKGPWSEFYSAIIP